MFVLSSLRVLGIRRGYATMSPAGLVQTSSYRFLEKVEEAAKTPEHQFEYKLLNKNYTQEFYKKYQNYFAENAKALSKKLISDTMQLQNENLEISKSKAVNALFLATERTAPVLVDYVIRNITEKTLGQDILRPMSIHLPDVIADTPQKVIDSLFERLMYNRMKPLNLQYYYNDSANAQNFNNNMTLNIMDIENPYEWFPEARKLKRKFIMHVGPTNSGKTYRALQRLEKCSKGYYAGPLRLLAREVYDKFQSKGLPCNLSTGEEVIVDVDKNGKKAGLTSGTIEMLSLNDTYDVIVVDEIQMMADKFRGSAWTNAILGARSKEIHLCGEESAVEMMKRIVAQTGDDLEINRYNRLGKLVVDDRPVQFKELQRGDCVVCFSKNAILDMKLRIESQTNLKCAVIYGALPPETRAQEAQRFNDGYYDLVVASDAIGMGLNLKINRVIFVRTEKYNGHSMQPLSNSEIKQIGGRAGRFGVNENGERSVGRVSAISNDELQAVRKGIDAPIQNISAAILWPPNDLWVRYYSMFARDTSMITMYQKFTTDVLDLNRMRSQEHRKKDFVIQSLGDRMRLAKFLHKEKLEKDLNIVDALCITGAPTPLTTNETAPLKVLLDYELMLCIRNIIDKTKYSLFDFPSMPFYLLSTETVPHNGVQYDKKVSTKDSTLIEADPIPAALKPDVVRRTLKSEKRTYSNRTTHLKRVSPVEDRLMKLERFHSMISTYMWLAYRYPQNFLDLESAVKIKSVVEFRISEMLGSLRAASKRSSRVWK